MPRYRDDWLIDRVMFDYLSGGSCACCGLSYNLFLPNGTADLISAMSDLESDQAQQEITALNSSKNPWPKELRDQVWADRVRLRQRMKQDMSSYYRKFWKEHGDACCEWLRSSSTAMLQRVFQVSRSEISLVLSERYNIHSAYGVVLCAAMEQIACFELTGYDPDGPHESIETEFESILIFDRRRGFTLKDLELNVDRVLDIWCRRFESLGGPKLLDKPKSERRGTNDDEEEQEPPPSSSLATSLPPSEPSFQSDRRILRLVIARYFADQIMKKYLGERNAPSLRDGSNV